MRNGPVMSRPSGPRRDGPRLSGVLDLFSRRVSGWAMAACQDESLVTAALQMALLRRHRPAARLFHSDRGAQYSSTGYRAVLAEANITGSMSRTGNWYDNAGTFVIFRYTQAGMGLPYHLSDTRADQTSHLRVLYHRVR